MANPESAEKTSKQKQCRILSIVLSITAIVIAAAAVAITIVFTPKNLRPPIIESGTGFADVGKTLNLMDEAKRFQDINIEGQLTLIDASITAADPKTPAYTQAEKEFCSEIKRVYPLFAKTSTIVCQVKKFSSSSLGTLSIDYKLIVRNVPIWGKKTVQKEFANAMANIIRIGKSGFDPDLKNIIFYDDKPCASNQCAPNFVCVPKYYDFKCECKEGYEMVNNVCKEKPGLTVDIPACTTCPKGFTGKSCETDLNECDNSQCKNEATCEDKRGGAACLCKKGYKGRICEIEINECDSGPCYNGSTCVDRIGGYACTCKNGFEGLLCQTDIDECASSPCQNGRCVDQDASYSCSCFPGYDGLNCQHDIDECAGKPCAAETQCVDLVNNFTCVCDLHWKGRLCDQPIGDCAMDCIHGKLVVDSVDGSRSCACHADFIGAKCETKIDQCERYSCDHGTCIDRDHRYSCTCSRGYDGADCSNDIDECVGDPCGAHGDCRDTVGKFVCICHTGYEGATCEITSPNCETFNCIYGKCAAGEGCTCYPGFEGEQCDTEINPCEASNLCSPNGECVKTRADPFYFCVCEAGWEKEEAETDNCNKRVIMCDPNPCVHGTCAEGVLNEFICTCEPGWKGHDCSVDIDECSFIVSPCIHKAASCVNEEGDYHCQECNPGMKGRYCDEEDLSCDWQPCHPKGTCSIGANSKWTCDCQNGFDGERCEIDKNECASEPCVYGTCLDLENSYFCECALGFEGEHCERSIDDCWPVACVAGGHGVCIDLHQDYKCDCHPGWTVRDEVNDDGKTYKQCTRDTICEQTDICGHGQCMRSEGISFTCDCQDGWFGAQCEFNRGG